MPAHISIVEARELATKAFIRHGINYEDTEIIVDHLLDGELSGHASHGFYRVPSIINSIQNVSKRLPIESLDETENTVLLNGGQNPGLVVALRATHIAIEKAKLSRIGIVGANNYVGTTGALGYFMRKIADSGLVGIMLANSEASIPAWGGKQPIFGTNPIAIAIPSMNDPIVVDLATSSWSYGDIALAIKESRQIPLGIVLDPDGNDSTDPNHADTGSMLPFGGHKGYSLALAFEILAGPLVRAKAGALAVKATDGLLILALNPEMFVPLEQFKEHVSSLINEIKNSDRRPNVDAIYFPGERSNIKRNENKQSGFIDIVDQIYAELRKLAGM